ncbi:MAG: NAD kinase [Bacteroidetes bacterium HGW-Bacteroidetes-9]|jgi:NAD+ kinase|nr:MAG: NAD kinase [Bacteroidetes bacterium HGW-Bacteroidetes-9]
MKIALFGKSFADDRFFYFQQLVEKLEESAISIMIYAPFYDYVKSKAVFTKTPGIFNDHHQLPGVADFMFSIGGDGTMLDAISLIRDSGLPLMGINLGRMGFLSSISKNEIGQAVDAILRSEYSLNKRSLLSVETKGNLFGELNYAMNELTINKKDSGSMILLHVYINDLLLNSYWADGLIISTPTGSTAYSLSCNGPIITPDSENFVITPIAPHNLTVRPVVIPDKSVIKIKVDGRMSQYLAGLDSRSAIIDSSTELLVRKASFCVNLVQRTNDNFFTTIRQKLLWGHDIRN